MQMSQEGNMTRKAVPAEEPNLLMKGATIIQNKVFMILTTLVIAILGAAMHGDWMIIIVHFIKQSAKTKNPTEEDNNTTPVFPPDADWLTRHHLAGVHWYILMAIAVSYVTYFGFCGFLQWHFYVKQRDQPEKWKCQPDRFLTPEDERHEILLGSLNMIMGGSYSGAIACYILNGGTTTMYFDITERSGLFLLGSTMLLFLFSDSMAYYMHRFLHEPYLYKYIHKWHHRYKAPTAFSATALHPVEFIIFQTILAAPIFIIPIYSGAFITVLLYNYYYGMVDHSGIMMDAIWPWQPPTIFHDHHHKYFHVNFGFNLKFWDWLHDTLHKDNRIYSEDIYGGRGLVDKKAS